MPLSEIVSQLEPLNSSHLTAFSVSDAGVSFSFNSEAALSNVTALLSAQHIPSAGEGLTLLVSHTQLINMLIGLGANESGLKESIESFYLAQQMDRAQLLAKDALSLSASDLPPLPTNFLQLSSIALGPKPKQLIAKLAIKMPPKEVAQSQAPAHVVFLLDRSNSMEWEGRLEMLKPAVINTISQLSKDTLISIYFYSDTFTNSEGALSTGVETLFESKAADSFLPEDIARINAVTVAGGTNVKLGIKAMVESWITTGILDDPLAYDNLTVVWLTDGADQFITSKTGLINCFYEQGCQSMPQLIAVGIGDYNRALLNGVAEDHRFKSNLMLHISSSEQTAQLFDVVTGCIGTNRQRVTLAFSVNNNMTFQDLGVMQAEQNKTLLMELPMPSSAMFELSCRLMLDDKIYHSAITLPANYRQANKALLIEYFNNIKDKIIMALTNNPQAAEAMRQAVIESIPATVRDPQLRTLRHEFLTSAMLKAQQEKKLSSATLDPYGGTFFDSPALNSRDSLDSLRQQSYSQSLQRAYSGRS